MKNKYFDGQAQLNNIGNAVFLNLFLYEETFGRALKWNPVKSWRTPRLKEFSDKVGAFYLIL